MRYTEKCPERKNYFGFYARMMEDDGDLKLYDLAYDRALQGTGRRQISNKVFLKKLMLHFLGETTSSGEL
jgi:hypothetical protein